MTFSQPELCFSRWLCPTDHVKRTFIIWETVFTLFKVLLTWWFVRCYCTGYTCKVDVTLFTAAARLSTASTSTYFVDALAAVTLTVISTITTRQKHLPCGLKCTTIGSSLLMLNIRHSVLYFRVELNVWIYPSNVFEVTCMVWSFTIIEQNWWHWWVSWVSEAYTIS